MAPTRNADYSGLKKISRNSNIDSDAMMAEKQKFSKGYSSGFVSDYRHAIDNMAGSEGLGSLGRVEAENNMAGSEGLGSLGRVEAESASEDSSAPKRKCISLNAESCDGFGIPVEVFKLSKMSMSGRKQLELRLKTELDKVQNLQKKITMQFTKVVHVSSSTDIHSCSHGQKGPFLENMHRLSELPSKQGSKKVPTSGNMHSLKRGLSGRFESLKEEVPSSVYSSKLMEKSEALLKRLMLHVYGWAFNTPVDVVKLNIPDYLTVIKNPMDLGTVKTKIASNQYSNPWEFLADVRLTFSNAMKYNPANNDYHIMAKTLSKFFESRWKNIQKKLPPIESVQVPVKSSISGESKAPKASSPTKKRKMSLTDQKEPVKGTMTEEDKQNLRMDLESLPEELPTHIIDFLHSLSEGQTAGEDEIELDIDALSDDTLFTLRKLVDDYLREKQADCTKVESEPELLNESGVSNSSMQPCKGNDPVDEDIGIGGNDFPVSSYPPVELEKDTVDRNSKGSSSSSSSSDSSSSSSDSGTSGSEAGAKASSPVNRTKETLDFGAALEQQTNNLESFGGLEQLERNHNAKLISFEADSREDEGNTLPERKVSPEKSYRVALLINRFADTIFKAREKTLNQGEKGDPEKLRREREELERQQREEKARLQAEAKAAEDARRQVEAKAAAEAAAEAKRKRELDREAARQALIQMEKTVEINVNCQFLEDLEMLRSVPAPHLPLAEVTSPDHFSDGMGGFKLQGSNPLEQLGLYMKMDDEEEEEAEPVCAPEPLNDVEEGEID
ncbi:Transcription factor gte8-like protein [Thalictrum thalictroides]|uniref:Transcription factor gte8-like protein n=1 Tax=Thalictrum thalictroides TaxID=46969 RepID=A0A7J6VGR0_THATH|nr:Transcription factor gte8-like protein [Thalictrum thalictroides]